MCGWGGGCPEIYLKFTWKIQASLAEFLPEHIWKTTEKMSEQFRQIFRFQVFLPEFYIKFSGKFTDEFR